MPNSKDSGQKEKFPFKGTHEIKVDSSEDSPLILKWERVNREASANIVLYVTVYGWRGDKRLAPRMIKGYFKVNEEAKFDLENCGRLHGKLASALLAEFREKAPKGQSWSISESYTTNPRKGKRSLNLPYYD